MASLYSVIIASVALTFVVSGSTTEIQKKWIENSQRTNNFKCRIPQPRSVDVQELFDDKTLKSTKLILPSQTVLHRCESSGCCTPNNQCLPVSTEQVELVFFNKVNDETRYLAVIAQNHTECACQHMTTA